MKYIAGIDGCKGSWLVARSDTRFKNLSIRVIKDFSEISDYETKIIAIDIPIGLSVSAQSREADKEAREKLGYPFSSRVFTPPTREVMEYFKNTIRPKEKTWSYKEKYHKTNNYSKEKMGIGLSSQAFGILPKIAEVDQFMQDNSSVRVYEVHPELSFREMKGESVTSKKKTSKGEEERKTLLCRAGIPLNQIIQEFTKGYGRDDLFDALAILWTARRIWQKKAYPLPEQYKERDERIKHEIAIWI